MDKKRYADVPVPSPWAFWAAGLAMAMVVFGLAWELILQPLREGSLLWIKVLPLALMLPGLVRGRVRAHQGMALLVWLYICEALVRVVSTSATEVMLSVVWLLLGLALFGAVSMGSRASRRIAAMVAAGDSPSDKALRQ